MSDGNQIETTPLRATFEPSDRFLAGRDMPPGTLGWYVDCADNPMDLRPAVDAITRAIDETRAKAPDGTPLMVLFGENHVCPTHAHLLPFVANRLRARGENFVVAQEGAFNLWTQIASRGMGFLVPEDLLRQPFYLYDETGRSALSALLGYGGAAMAPVSTHNILAFLQEKGLKVVFNDASYIPRLRELDLENPVVARAVQAQSRRNGPQGVLAACAIKDYEWKNENLNKDPTSPEGIAIRNAVMTDLAVDFAGRHKAPVILQQIGLSHLFGYAADGCAYTDSLHAMATHRGLKVVSVFSTKSRDDYGLNLLPFGAQGALKDTVVIDGLGEDEFGHGSGGPELEKAYLHGILEASGNEISFYDVEGSREDWRARAQEEAEQILNTYHARQTPRTVADQGVEKPLAFGP